VLFEDADLLALNKPAGLLVAPDRCDLRRANLLKLMHRDIERQASWASSRGLTYLANVHRLDFDTTGVLLLAKNRPAFTVLVEQFGMEKPRKTYVALVRGAPLRDEFSVDVKLAPDERRPGLMRWTKAGKKSLTHFRVLERFAGASLVECRPVTDRTHQIRVHLRRAGYPVFGDALYGGTVLRLSQLKPAYRLKPGKTERPLTSTLALHSAELEVLQPTQKDLVRITAPWPRDLKVAVNYLRRYAAAKTEASGDEPRKDSNLLE
jgi:23S rRNA pseudouridine1911/1915/1917 synthase